MSTDWSGDDYATISGLQRAMAETSLAGLNFSGVQRILDIGCGDGFVTRSIVHRAPEAFVAGVDPSPLMIATAHRESSGDIGGPRYVIGDVLRLPFGEHFDVVVAFNALHWVHDQRRALQQIATVLHADGWALVQMVCQSPRRSVEDSRRPSPPRRGGKRASPVSPPRTSTSIRTPSPTWPRHQGCS